MLKGIEISRKYLDQIVGPAIQSKFPEQYGRCVIGLLGKGSDCRGWDDELSKDHSWDLVLPLS